MTGARADGASWILPMALAAVPLIAVFGIGGITLFDVDEAVFAQATKEMIQGGDWITPAYNGTVRYDKPILFYWLMALSYGAFGISEFAARLPSAVAGCLTALSLLLFVRRVIGGRHAGYAVMCVSLNAYCVVYSCSAVTDMVLCLFIGLSLMSFYLSDAGDRRFILGFYVFSALAFLTKGLVGILFPFGIAVIYLLVRGGIGAVRGMFDLRSAIAFAAIAAPWYAVQLGIHGREFFEQFFVRHHFQRYTGTFCTHGGPPYYFLVALVIGMAPWVSFLPGGIKVALAERAGPRLFALIWLAFVVVFFTFSGTKLPNYILPAIPAVALLSAAGMTDAGERWRRGAWIAAGIGSILGAAALCGAAFVLRNEGIDDGAWAVCAAAVSVAGGWVSVRAARVSGGGHGALAASTLVVLAILLFGAAPVAGRQLQGALHGFSLWAKEKSGPGERVICYGINHPSIAFYSDRRLANVTGAQALRDHVSTTEDRIAISKAGDAPELIGAGFHLVREEGGYALFERR